MITATAADMKENFDRYLRPVMSGYTVSVTKDGREVGRLVPTRSCEGCLGTYVSTYLPS